MSEELAMMPVIRVSDRTWERLKSHARPLEDSVDDVVNAALNALDAQKGVRLPKPENSADTKSAEGPKLPQKEFRQPLIAALKQLGGRAGLSDIRALIEPKIAHRLSPADYEKVSTGEPRWWNAVCWERSELVKEGVLRKDSQRGVWELV